MLNQIGLWELFQLDYILLWSRSYLNEWMMIMIFPTWQNKITAPKSTFILLVAHLKRVAYMFIFKSLFWRHCNKCRHYLLTSTLHWTIWCGWLGDLWWTIKPLAALSGLLLLSLNSFTQFTNWRHFLISSVRPFSSNDEIHWSTEQCCLCCSFTRKDNGVNSSPHGRALIQWVTGRGQALLPSEGYFHAAVCGAGD